MAGVHSVFISHTHADNERCAPLLAMLDAWGIPYWFDIERLSAGQELSERLQQALAQSDGFIRVCTLEAQRSYWMSKELSAYRSLAGGGARKLIFLILDRDYVVDAQEKGEVVIDTTSEPAAAWIARLRTALGVKSAARRMSRRAALGLGAAATVALAGLGTGVLVAVDRSLGGGTTLPRPTSYLPTSTPAEGAKRLKWTFAYVASIAPVDLTAAGGDLYFSTDLGLVALSGADGGELWSSSSTGPTDVPQVAGTMLYTSDSNGSVFGTRLADGKLLWHFAIGGFTQVSLAATASAVYAWANGALYALGPDGAKRWSVPLGPQNSAESAGCAAAGGLVYVNAPDGFLYAASAAAGAPVWRQPIAGTYVPTVAGGVLYVPSGGGAGPDGNDRLYALDAIGGAPLWSADLGDGAGGPATIAGNLALVGGITNGLVAVDLANHQVAWTGVFSPDEVDPGISCRPAVAGAVAYVTTHDGYLVAFRVSDGKPLWRFAVGGSFLSTSPVVDGGLVYVSGGDSLVGIYALDPSLP